MGWGGRWGDPSQGVKPKEDRLGLDGATGWSPAAGSAALYHETLHETSGRHTGVITEWRHTPTDPAPTSSPAPF